MFSLFLEKIKKFLRIAFVRDVAILEMGKFFNIFLSLAASVVFARVLQPERYGIYSLVFSLAGLIGLLMNVGASPASLTLLAEAYAKKDKKEIQNILIYFLKISSLVLLIIGGLGIYLAPFLAYLLYQNYQIGQLTRVIILTKIIGLFFGLTAITLQVTRRMRDLTILENLEKFLKSLIPISLVLLGLGLWGLVFGHLVAALLISLISFWFYTYLAGRDEYLPRFSQLIRHFRKFSLKRYFSFGFLIAIDKNLAKLFTLLPVLFLGLFVPPAQVGFFKIAFGYMSIPLILLGPISRLLAVQLPKSKTYGMALLKSHFLKVSFYSGLISLALVIPFLILGPVLIRIFYGSEYAPSIPLIYYLAIYIGLVGFGVGIGPIFRTLNKMKTIILINLIVLSLGSLFGYWLISQWGMVGACLMFVLLSLISIFISLIFILRYL